MIMGKEKCSGYVYTMTVRSSAGTSHKLEPLSSQQNFTECHNCIVYECNRTK